MGCSPFQRHEGLCFTNVGTNSADLVGTTGYDGMDHLFTLAPNQKFTISAHDGGATVGDMTFEVRNGSRLSPMNIVLRDRSGGNPRRHSDRSSGGSR